MTTQTDISLWQDFLFWLFVSGKYAPYQYDRYLDFVIAYALTPWTLLFVLVFFAITFGWEWTALLFQRTFAVLEYIFQPVIDLLGRPMLSTDPEHYKRIRGIRMAALQLLLLISVGCFTLAADVYNNELKVGEDVQVIPGQVTDISMVLATFVYQITYTHPETGKQMTMDIQNCDWCQTDKNIELRYDGKTGKIRPRFQTEGWIQTGLMTAFGLLCLVAYVMAVLGQLLRKPKPA